MKKQELVEALANKTNLTKIDAETAITSLVEIIVENVKKGNEVSVTGLGKFERVQRKARNGINPSTKAPIKIAAKKAPKFKAAKAFKEAVT